MKYIMADKRIPFNKSDNDVILAPNHILDKKLVETTKTNGVATSSMHIVKSISGNAGNIMTVSTLHDGEYGIKDVCLSSLSLVNEGGVQSIITQKLSDDEMRNLYNSANVLKEILKSSGF